MGSLTVVEFTRSNELTKAYNLNKEFFDRWAHNLETTKMVQCNGVMTTGEGTACCLHVLECYEQNAGRWFNTNGQVPTDIPDDDFNSDRTYSALTNLEDYDDDKVAIESLIAVSSNRGVSGNKWFSFAELNDTGLLTFSEIAKLIKGETVTATYEGDIESTKIKRW